MGKLAPTDAQQRRDSAPTTRRKLFARRMLIVLGYWLLSVGAWRLAIPFEIAPRISVWWPPSGITFAFLLLFGWRYLPAVAVPQLAIMALIMPDRPELWIAMAAIVCAAFGSAAEAVRRIAGPVPFLSARDACVFLVAAFCAAAAVAVPASILLGLAEGGAASDLGSFILAWWIGDLAAVTVLTPFAVFALEPIRRWADGAPQSSAPQFLEAGDFRSFLGVLGVIALAFAIAVAGALSTGYTWFFVLFLPALYAGYALGPRASTATALVVGLGSLALLQSAELLTRPLDLQFFMIATASSSLLFAIVVSDWRAARRSLLEQQAQLEERVLARTRELAEANAMLESEVHIRSDAERALVTAKEASEASYRELEAVYRHAPVGLTMIDSEFRFLRINDTIATINGLPVAEHSGRSLFDVVPEIAPAIIPYLRDVFETGDAIRNIEIRGTTRGRSGETIWLDHFYPLKRADGTVEAVNIVVQDITDQRRTEEELLRAKNAAEQASALKSRFLAATSHDLRQPLQTLSLLQSILVERIKDENIGRIIGQMGIAIDVMTDTLNALLDIDGLEKGRLEPKITDFPVQALFERIRNEFGSTAASKKLQLKCFVCEAYVHTDQRLLERLVENFVANAVKYTEKGKILVGCRRRGEVARIEVWDTGPGISASEQSLVFEQFYRGRTAGAARERGLGLGLALVRSLADILDLRVGVKSDVGRGSMFFVEVPLGAQAMAQPASAATKQKAAAVEQQPPTVILIEDDPAVRESLVMLLAGSGYLVRAAASGEEAVRLVEADDASPSLVIADHNLPGVLSGVDAAERIRGRRGQVAGLILTGEGSREKLELYTSAGVEWLQKPVKADELLARVRDLVAAGAGEPAAVTFGDAPVAAPVAGDADENDADDGRANVFIVEDDPGLRTALSEVLEHEGFRAHTYPTAADFLARHRHGRGGCIVIDIGLPGMNGLQLQQRLKSEEIDLPVIIVSGRGEVALAVQAMRDGAVDFLQKPVNERMLLQTVHRALRQSAAMAEVDAERALINEHMDRLTPREREILTMVAAGLANKEIAARLDISQRTVENHRARVMHKMEMRSLADLVRAVNLAGDLAEAAPFTDPQPQARPDPAQAP